MKTLISRLFLLATMVIVFTSCEKEFSVEGIFTGLGNQGGTAVFSLDGAPGACLGASVQGTYTKDVAMGPTNLVFLTVNVTQLGTYTISTGTINGFSFSGSGTFTTLGLQFIQLTATGTPTNSGTAIFLPGTTPCSFSVTVGAGSGGSSSGTSAYTFNGAPNACATPMINGTYTSGTALTASNTVVLMANVTTAGTYNITTTNNGMTFTASGTFAATGPNQSVTFVGSGTPASAGSINFLSGSATAGCTFTIPVTAGATPTVFIKATIGGVAYEFNSNIDVIDQRAASPASFDIYGDQSSPAGGTGDFNIIFYNLSAPVTTGSFANLSATNTSRFVGIFYNNTAGTTYITNTTANSFTSSLSTLTANSATGTFQGALADGSGNPITVTAGSFAVNF